MLSKRRQFTILHALSELVQGLGVAVTFPLISLVAGAAVAGRFIVATSLFALASAVEFNLAVSVQRIWNKQWQITNFKGLILIYCMIGAISVATLGALILPNSRVIGTLLGSLAGTMLPLASVGRGLLRWKQREVVLSQVPMMSAICRSTVIVVAAAKHAGSETLITIWLVAVIVESAVFASLGVLHLKKENPGLCRTQNWHFEDSRKRFRSSLQLSGLSSFVLVLVSQFDRVLVATTQSIESGALMLYVLSLFAGSVRIFSSILKVIQSSTLSQSHAFWRKSWSRKYDQLTLIAAFVLFALYASFELFSRQQIELIAVMLFILSYRSFLAIAASASIVLSSHDEDRFLLSERAILLCLVVLSTPLVKLDNLLAAFFALSGLHYLLRLRAQVAAVDEP